MRELARAKSTGSLKISHAATESSSDLPAAPRFSSAHRFFLHRVPLHTGLETSDHFREPKCEREITSGLNYAHLGLPSFEMLVDARYAIVGSKALSM